MVSHPSDLPTIIMEKFRAVNRGEEADGTDRPPGGRPHLPGNASGDVGGEEPEESRGADEAHPRPHGASLGLRPRDTDLPPRSGPCAGGPLPGQKFTPTGTYISKSTKIISSAF